MSDKDFWLYEKLFKVLDSSYTPFGLAGFCVVSFTLGQWIGEMGLFASSGGVMSIFGLISLIKYQTFKKLLNKDSIAEEETGVTGPPISQEEADRLKANNIAKAKERIHNELRAELKGFALSVVGTLIAAYGAYVPVFN